MTGIRSFNRLPQKCHNLSVTCLWPLQKKTFENLGLGMKDKGNNEVSPAQAHDIAQMPLTPCLWSQSTEHTTQATITGSCSKLHCRYKIVIYFQRWKYMKTTEICSSVTLVVKQTPHILVFDQGGGSATGNSYKHLQAYFRKTKLSQIYKAVTESDGQRTD